MSVRLYDGDNVVGVVDYTDNLDHWDGSNWTAGGTGIHLGIGKTKDGRYYLCHGTQWQGEQDRAEIVDIEVAKKTVLEHDPDEYESMFGTPVPDLTA